MIKYSILSDNSEETIEQKILTTEMKTRSTEKFDANRSENTENKRLVKCPKCHKVLRKPNAPVSVYRCGGCGAVLRAKLRTTSGETTTTESNPNISMDLSEKDSFNESLTVSASKSSILSDNSEETIEQKILTTEMKTRSTEKFNANRSEKTEIIRLVKCPKCHKVLPEPNAPKYRCGGCGVLLRAKLRTSGETTKTESNPNIFMDLSEKDFFSESLTVSASKSSILSDTSEETIEQKYLTTEIQMRSTEKLEANRSEKTEILSHENINLNSNSNLTENSSKEEHVDSITNKEEPDIDPFGGSSHEKPLIGRQSISSLKRIEIEDWIHTLPVGIPCDYDARDLSILPSEKEKSISVISINDKGGLTGHMVDKVTIFGRSAETMEVSNFLLSEREKSFSVISIVGKGGLGKTTIAQLVYKDLRASRCFDLFGWVCVSEGFDVRRLIKLTIESISKINYGVSELSLLQVELAEIVKEKTILLVLDDVCNENQSLWELFQELFIEAKMVRILVTTRNEKVAEVMQTTTCYRPTNLPEYSCWQLFQHHALSSTCETLPTHLVDMGREIMRKCDGLPLAVKIIACLLRHETNEKVWREILESDLWKSNPTNNIFPALQISYDHLPAHLKLCFLVCSMYPKDYLLEKMNLIHLWISHGYIESRGKRRTTEIGVEYYEELKERSFIDGFSNCIPEWWHMQPMYALDESSGQFFEFCKLHDIIHDLARYNSKKEHYSMEINQPLDIQKENFPPEVHHLYAGGFVGYVKQILQRNDQNLKDLRTLSLDVRGCSGDLEHQYCINNTEAVDLNSKLSKDYEECSGEVAISNIIKFEGLTVLELKGYNLRKIPDCISKLKHLAYLGITSSCLKVLPLSIGLLYNLQTLFLDCFLLEYLPESIGNLANLQFLYIQSGRVKKLPKSLCSLNNLLRLVVRSDDLEEVPLDIKNLCNLHTLTIRSNQIQALPNTIGCLTNLEELNLLSLGGSYDDLPVGKLDYVPHGYVNFPAIKIMAAWMGVRTINWLKDMKDLEGKLSIGGLKHMSNLEDAQHANLRNKCKLETLDLCWDPGYYISPYDAKSELRLSLIPEACKGELVCADDVVSFSLLECLQPHPKLKKLLVRWYPSAIVPYWMTDPSSFQSIQEVLLECCVNIQSLPFENFHTLKHLTIVACSSIRVLQLEQVSYQLEKLQIVSCDNLELITGLGDLDMLAALEIYSCQALKSLTMGGKQLVLSTETFGDSSHEKPHTSKQSIVSLGRLEIENCYLLHFLPDGLIPPGPCYVCIRGCGCPDMERNLISATNEISCTSNLWR